jgi:hypothetical protein
MRSSPRHLAPGLLLALVGCRHAAQGAPPRATTSAPDTPAARPTPPAAPDALDWVRARVRPQAGAATVLYHSIFWQYLPVETREGLVQAIAEIGSQASAEAPFAWLRMEPPPDNLAKVELRLTLWPGGEDRLLAETHPHGAWVRWG